MAATTASGMADYMEAVARHQKLEPPHGYGYKADVGLGVGCFQEENHGCKLLEKPVVIPNGTALQQGYIVLFAYCQKAGMVSILEGQLPPMLPATTMEPRAFSSLVKIADNFGNKDPQAAAANSEYCVAFRVPAEIAMQADTPGRDLWLVRFDQNMVGPFLQVVKEGALDKVRQGLQHDELTGEVVDEQGVSAVMMAAMGGWEETCQALLEKGADANGVEPLGGKTPLMFAAQGGFDKVVQVLLQAKADPSRADKEGSTPLMWAAVAGKANVVRLLAPLSPTDAVNIKGMTALQIAQEMKHADVVAALS